MDENMRICFKQMESLVETSKSDFHPSLVRSFFVCLRTCTGSHATDNNCVKAYFLPMRL